MRSWTVVIETTGLVQREMTIEVEAKDSREAVALALYRMGEFNYGETLHIIHVGRPK